MKYVPPALRSPPTDDSTWGGLSGNGGAGKGGAKRHDGYGNSGNPWVPTMRPVAGYSNGDSTDGGRFRGVGAVQPPTQLGKENGRGGAGDNGEWGATRGNTNGGGSYGVNGHNSSKGGGKSGSRDGAGQANGKAGGKSGGASYNDSGDGSRRKGRKGGGKGCDKGGDNVTSRGDGKGYAKGDNGKMSSGAVELKPSPPARAPAPRSNKNVASRTSSTTLENMTDQRFEDLQGVSVATKQALSDVFDYVTMTKVQAMTIQPCLSGVDVVAKAKTGTGKTLGFLIPAVELGLIQHPTPHGQIAVLCVSPTRELAQQTTAEANALLTYHADSFRVQCVVGGTNTKSEASTLRQRTPSILVATPGRLNDHLVNSGLGEHCQNIRVLVFDEADQLLDMGFRPAIEQMLRRLPSKETRQTLLFSATFPKLLDQIAKVALRTAGGQAYTFVDTLGEEEIPTHMIPQSSMVTTIEEQMPTVMAILAQQDCIPDHKVIVFMATARLTQLYAQVFNALADIGIFKAKALEIHSRRSQAQRTRTSEEFRTSQQAILFSSDVSARGMDYPDVSFVLQVSLPSDKAQYVHRLGRTARAGKSGQGMLLLADFEKYFLRQLEELPVETAPAVPKAELDPLWYSTEAALVKVHRANPQIGGMAYQAWLGFYNSFCGKLRWSKRELVERANNYALECLKLAEVPSLEPKTVGMMGLKGIPGLRIERVAR